MQLGYYYFCILLLGYELIIYVFVPLVSFRSNSVEETIETVLSGMAHHPPPTSASTEPEVVDLTSSSKPVSKLQAKKKRTTPSQIASSSQSAHSSSSKINSPVKAKDSMDLKTIVQHFILVGLTSVTLWEEALTSIKAQIVEMLSTDVLELFIALNHVTKVLSDHVMLSDDDLSQHKLTLLNSQKLGSLEITSILEPVFASYEGKMFSKSSLTAIHNMIKTYINNSNDKVNISDSEDSSNVDEVMALFSENFNVKKGASFKGIKQQFSLLQNNCTKKFITPVENGQYMVKIEVTDTDDLKGVSFNERWTKVWKRTTFMVDKEEELYKKVDKVLIEAAKKIVNHDDVERVVIEDEEDAQPTPKKQKYTRY